MLRGQIQNTKKGRSSDFHTSKNGDSDDTVVDRERTEDQSQGGAQIQTRPKREKKRPTWPDDFVGLSIEDIDFDDMAAYALSIFHDEPRDYKDAISSVDSSSWLVAMEEEIESLNKNHTWDLVPFPSGRRPI